MKIRAFVNSDYQTLLDIYAHSKLDELRFETDTFELLPLEKDRKRLGQLMESDIFVYDDGEVLGYGALFGNEIRALFVAPDARKKGIGRLLLEFLLSRVSGRVNLYVAKTNKPAKRLYQAYGFTVEDEFLTEYNGKPVYANEMVRPENNDS